MSGEKFAAADPVEEARLGAPGVGGWEGGLFEHPVGFSDLVCDPG